MPVGLGESVHLLGHHRDALAGRVAVFTTTYTVTQADINNDTTITDSAKASGTIPGNVTFSTTAATGSFTIAQTTGLTTTKIASPTTISRWHLDYLLVHRHQQRRRDDVQRGVGGPPDNPEHRHPGQWTYLHQPHGPGGCLLGQRGHARARSVANYTATLITNQNDLNAGSIADSATATGKTPASVTITSNTALNTVAVTQTASLTISKSVSPATASTASQVETSSFTVTNNGNVTLTNVGVADVQTGGTGTLPATPTCQWSR